MRNVKQEILNRHPENMRDKLVMRLPNGESPFRDAPRDPKTPPEPPSLTGPYRTDYINNFGRTDPTDPETGDNKAVAIIKAICFPSDAVFDKIDKDFGRAVAAASATTSLEWSIRGAFLADIYTSPNGANNELANCIAILLAVNIGPKNGGLKPVEPRTFARRGINIPNLVKRLSNRYPDFKHYYQTLQENGESLDHISQLEADGKSGLRSLLSQAKRRPGEPQP